MLDPIGTWRDDFRMGQVCATIVQSIHSVVSTKGSAPSGVTAKDFIPEWGVIKKVQPIKQQTVEEMKSTIQSIASFFGVKKKGK